MELSLILGQIFGIYFLILGVAMLVNPVGFRTMIREVAESPAALTVAGVITLLLGITLVVIHNQWGLQWSILITVLSWLILIKGAIRLFVPRLTKKLTHLVSNNTLHFIFALIVLALGLYFIYFSIIVV